MPPKKDLSNAPVLRMDHEDQVRLLSEALLREYMHKLGFKETLRAFDEENPRGEDTISSRALMSDLMALSAETTATLKEKGIETIMEMLCDLRVERRIHTAEIKEEIESIEVPEIPEDYAKLKAASEKRKQKKKEKANSMGGDDGEDELDKKKKKKKKEKKAKKEKGKAEPSVDEFGLPLDPAITIDDLLGSSSSSSKKESVEGQDERNGEEEDGERELELRESTEVYKNSGEGRDGADRNEDVSNGEEESLHGSTGNDVYGGAQLLPSEAALTALRVLCGKEGIPPDSFIHQGFVFDESMEYALIQWQHGPSAAMAAIQGFVCAYFYEKEYYAPTEEKQRMCLKRALITILTKAQPQVKHVVLVHGLLGKGKEANRRVQQHMRSQRNFYQWTGFSSTEELEECLDALLDAEGGWGEERGSGLWCFLVSVVLSRGSAAVGKDMDVTCSALIHDDGSGSLELCNLCLTGRAVSFTFNHESGSHQRGYTSSTLVGILSGETEEEEGEDGGESVQRTFATEPSFPSWVIHCKHRRYFTNIFMKKDLRKTFHQKKKLGGDITLEFVYWDCATEDDAVELQVIVSSTGLGQSRRAVGATSFVTKALLTVPMWSSGHVDWCGNSPIRAP